MNDRPQQPAWFFWFFAVYTALTMLGFSYLAFDFVTHPLAPDYTYGSVAYRMITALVIAPLGVITSIMILRRSPRNVIGLFLLSWTAVIMVGSLRLDSPMSGEVFNFSYQGFWLLPLFFPDGQASPRRFGRALRYFAVITALSFFLSGASMPTLPLYHLGETIGEVANPLFIAGLAPFAGVINTVQSFVWLASLLLIVPSLVIRYRSANTTIRQQIKWFAWVYGIIAGTFLVMIGLNQLEEQGIGTVFFSEFFRVAPFLSIGFAILRHQLYDVDIIIRRTLVYSILTAVLAAIYFGGVVVAQQVFRAISGEGSDLAIVVSTLLIAASFTPLRRRIQQSIDRRFYRRKYNAERTLARFNRTLRDEVDVETLKGQLVGVVNETMQPDRMALWLKQEPRHD